MRKFILFFIGSVVSLTLWSQNNCDKHIRGTIKDIESGKPLAYATVKIVNTNIGSVTDQDGVFLLENICEEEVHLEVMYVGYKTATHHHDFYHSAPTIYLAPNEIELKSIIIEESRDKGGIKSLKTLNKKVESLESIGANAGTILQAASGVSVLKSGQNIVKPLVHGLHSNRVLIINNGVRHSYQAWGQGHAPELDPTQIDRFSLVKGAATVKYGPEALGGVILVNADQPSFDAPIGAEIGTGFQSNGNAFSGQLALNQGFHRFAWNASAYSTKQGDLKAPDYHLTNTGKSETGFQLGARLHRPKYDLDLYANTFSQTLGILRGSVVGSLEDLVEAIQSDVPENTSEFSYDINNPRQETKHDLIKLKSSFYLDEHEVSVQYAFQQNLRKEFDIRRGTNNDLPSINLNLKAHSVDADWNYPDNGWLEGSLGAQFFYQDNNNIAGTNTIPFIPNYNVMNVGVYTVQSTQQGNSTYEFGFRYDYQSISARGRDQQNNIYRNDLSYKNVTFSLGYTNKLSEALTLRTNIGSAWRPPKVGELYSFGKHQFNFQYGLWRYETFAENDSISTSRVLDNDLKNVESEKGLKWIGALEITRSNFHAEVVPYVNFIRNFFFSRPFGITNTARGPFPYFIYDQTNALFMGMDLDIRMEHNPTLHSEAKAAYVHAQDVKNDQQFLEIPPLNVSYTIKKDIKAFAVEMTADWNARQWNAPSTIDPSNFLETDVQLDRSGTFDFVSAPDAFLLLHMRMSYSKKQLEAAFTINNIFDHSYRLYTDRLRYFADDVGRNISINLIYHLSK